MSVEGPPFFAPPPPAPPTPAPAYAGVKFIDKSTSGFFFSCNFLQTETNSGKLLITVQAHLVCIKGGRWGGGRGGGYCGVGGTGATLGFLPDFQEMLQHLLLYH